MKVLGKEKDFYDSALDYSNADQETWFRDFKIFQMDKTLEKEMPEKHALFQKVIEKSGLIKISKSCSSSSFWGEDCFTSTVYISNGFVLFAGKIYPFIKISDNDKRVDVFYNADSFINRMESTDLSHVLDEKDERFLMSWRYKRVSLREQIVEMFNIALTHVDFNALHVELETPIFIYDYNVNSSFYKDSHFQLNSKKSSFLNTPTVIESGRLDDYLFIKVFDPHSFVQELEMFMGNILIKRDPIPVFTDKDKILSHGFDNKLSFRKEKQSKK